MVTDKYEAEAVEEISSLFKSYGYGRYKLGSFEEYSLYQQNKDFLVSKNVITFSDPSGRLMAIRPDVTLSIIRHNDVSDSRTEKFFYNEKVYRQTVGSADFREINQTGVEVFGYVDDTTIAETTLLALKTLKIIGDDYVLDLSHMGYIEGLLQEFTYNKNELLDCLKRKDLHDYMVMAKTFGYSDKLNKAFTAAIKTDGNVEDILKCAALCSLNETMSAAVEELEKLYSYICKLGFGKYVNINFSATGNADYYNGVIFNGYVNGVPHRVLSGGRYDRLLKKLNKDGSAIGFALYLGELDRYFKQDKEIVDCLIVYNSECGDRALLLAERLMCGGKSVRLTSCLDCGVRYSELIDLRAKEN